MPNRLGVAFQNRRRRSLQVGEEFRIEDDAVFHDLGQATAIFAIRQRAQESRVDPDADRLMEGADQVLAARMIDADLAADELSTIASSVVGTMSNGRPRF